MRTRQWEYNALPLNLADKAAINRILEMAAEEGWELHSIVPLPANDPDKPMGMAIYQRRFDRSDVIMRNAPDWKDT